MTNAELIKSARTIADSIHVHSSFQDWEAAEKDTLEKCADALEAAEKRIAELEQERNKTVTAIFGEEQKWWENRCKELETERMELTAKCRRFEAKKPKTVKETGYSFYCDCPTCGGRLISNVDGEWCAGSFDRFCRMCGQKIDWSEYCRRSNMPRGAKMDGERKEKEDGTN